MVERVIADLGPLDILVNNAGSLVKRYPLRDLTEEGWDEIMDLNLKSAVLCTQAVVPFMIERKSGAVVNVVSIAAHNGGGPGAGPYAASKAALIAMTKSQAKEPIQLDIILVCRKQEATEGIRPSVAQAVEAAQSKLGRLRAAGFELSCNDRKIVIFGQLLTTLGSPAEAEQIALHADAAIQGLEPVQPAVQSQGQLLLFD